MVTLCLSGWLTYTFYIYNTSLEAQQKIQAAQLNETKVNKIDFFIADGDAYFNKQQWHNAAFQYHKALNILPDNYNLMYKVASAYTNNCMYHTEDCDAAYYYLNKLLEKHPDKPELLELQKIITLEP